MKRKKRGSGKKFYFLISIFSLLLFVTVWTFVTDILQIFPPQSLPSPLKVIQTLIVKLSNRAPDGGTIQQHIWASLKLALYGFSLGALIGIPLGIVMAWYHKVDLLVTPIFDFLRPIPPIAWIPLMLIFFGIGQTSKAVVIFVCTVSHCILNSYTGVKQTKDVHIWVARTFGASDFEILLKVAIPSALPMIFTGLGLSLTASWMSLVAVEMLAADKGLGYMIQYGRMMGRADIVFAGMIVITIIGAIFNKLLGVVEGHAVRGRQKK